MTKRILSALTADSTLIQAELERILALDDADYGVLLDSMRYSTLKTAGKRIRPFLTLQICRALGGKDEAALPLACAVELVHTYSLIHDDLPCMDDDDMRRGMPSNHKVYGEATALLAGDGLLTLAFSVIANADALSEHARINAVAALADAAGCNGMIGGQQIDLLGETVALSKDSHKKMNLLKTAAMIKTAAIMGCIAANATASALDSAKTYAECIGLAFQVKDDLLDIGQEDEKTTYLSFMTKDEATSYLSELTEKAIKAIAPIDTSGILTDTALFLRDRTV